MTDLRPVAVFDLDGTLFDARSVTTTAVRDVLLDAGVAVPSEHEVVAFIGRPVEDFHRWLGDLAGDPSVGPAVSARELELVSPSGVFDGVDGALDELAQAGVALALLSNGPHEYVAHVLAATGLASRFATVRWREPADTGKPQMLHEVLDALGAPSAVVVGDRGDDLDAAAVNGCASVAVSWGIGDRGELAAADLLVDDPGALAAAVLGLLART